MSWEGEMKKNSKFKRFMAVLLSAGMILQNSAVTALAEDYSYDYYAAEEEAARIAQEEADRMAAEEAARFAAEQEAREFIRQIFHLS